MTELANPRRKAPESLVLAKIKRQAHSVLDPHPALASFIRQRHFGLWRMKLFLRGQRFRFDNSKVVWINPQEVERSTVRVFDPYFDRGKVVGGHWDLQRLRVTDWASWRKFDLMVADREPWKSLLAEIRDKGYRIQRDVYRGEDPSLKDDDVTVNIGRDGSVLFNDGMHRFFIARKLGLTSIPARIVVRHSEWIRFRAQLDYVIGRRPYQPLTHPDLQNYVSVYGEARYYLIRSNMVSTEGTLLDMGSYLGYFCHKFEQDGFRCKALENDWRYVYLATKLRDAEERHFTMVETSLQDYLDRRRHFNVVLALNVLHHLLKTEKSYRRLAEALGNLEADEFFLQTHRPDEEQMRTAYRNLDPDEFVDFILMNTDLDEAQLLGSTFDGRRIYRLSRYR